MGQYLINLLKVLLEIDKKNEHVLYGENLKEEILYSTGLLRRPVKTGLLAMTSLPVPFYTRDDLIRKTLWEKFVFPNAVKKDKPDLVWSPYFSVSKIDGINHVMTIHDVIYRIFPQYIPNWRWKFYYNLAESAARKADQVITISQCSKNDIVKFLEIKEEKIKTIYLGRPVLEKENQAGLNKYSIKNKYIFYIGGFDYRKNVVKLIDSYKIFCESNDNIDLVIAGKLPKQPNPIALDVEKKVKELGLQDKVRFIGYVADENLPELYKNAAVFVFPTLYEGFGLPVLEAMTYGCPVITSNNSSIIEITSEAALLVNPYNSEDIAKAIEKVLSDEKLRQAMIQKGIENAQRFSWEKCAIETLRVFDKQ